MKELINATQQEELRVALVDGQKLYDWILKPGHEQKNQYYKGTIRVEPSLEPLLSIMRSDRHGFFPLRIAREISPGYRI